MAPAAVGYDGFVCGYPDCDPPLGPLLESLPLMPR